MRLEGRSAIDRYVAVHAALAEHEARINAAVEHPAMRALELAYPVSVGRVAARRLVELGAGPARVRGPRRRARGGGSRRGARRVRGRGARAPTARIRRSRSPGPAASFASGETDPAHPWVERVLAAVRAERGAAAPAGVPWGADMRLFCARGIPT